MEVMSSEKKLIEAFKVFVEKSIIPCIYTNWTLMREWKDFLHMISVEPIDYHQI
jgi:hypothetical protein